MGVLNSLTRIFTNKRSKFAEEVAASLWRMNSYFKKTAHKGSDLTCVVVEGTFSYHGEMCLFI